jgi:molybdenum cofactor cytidylyltransferase
VKIGAIVLAAGGSTRLGQPKQLLPYKGQPLVRSIASAALEAGCDPVVVVVGAEKEKVVGALRGLAVKTVPNESWERGMGTSIRAGVAPLQECGALIILACDQPHVDAAVLGQLIKLQKETRHPMAACAYAGTRGVPALFAQSLFPDLLALRDAEGARKILMARPEEVALVDFPPGKIDIDTIDDYRALLA